MVVGFWFQHTSSLVRRLRHLKNCKKWVKLIKRSLHLEILRFLSNNCTKLTIFWGVRCLTISFWTSWILLISLVFVRSCLSTMQEKCVNISLYFFVIVFTRTEIHWCNTLTLRKIDVFLKVPNFCLISVEFGLARNCSYSELRKQNVINDQKKKKKLETKQYHELLCQCFCP